MILQCISYFMKSVFYFSPTITKTTCNDLSVTAWLFDTTLSQRVSGTAIGLRREKKVRRKKNKSAANRLLMTKCSYAPIC